MECEKLDENRKRIINVTGIYVMHIYYLTVLIYFTLLYLTLLDD